MEFNITITGYDASVAEDTIKERVVTKIVEMLEPTVREAVNEKVSELANDMIAERLTLSVDEILTDGWDEEVRGGYSTHKVHRTLREKIEEALKPGDGYNRHSYSLPGIVTAELRGKFDAEIKAGTQRLREQIDAIINGQIEEVITGDIRTKLRRVLSS